MEAPLITLRKAGKKFGKEWIFRGMDLEIEPGSKLAVTGGNGSGKSTLLQIISGFVLLTEGTVNYGNISPEEIHKHVSFASPYLQLPEDLSLREIIEHTAHFKPFYNNRKAKEVIEYSGLLHAADKPVKQFSSGMKQRLKLSLALMSDTPIVLLDEPVSNLDAKAIGWYRQMIGEFTGGRTVIVCSNSIPAEYDFCTLTVDVEKHKPASVR